MTSHMTHSELIRLDSAVLQDALSVRTGQRMVGTVFHRADEVVGGEGLEEEERQMRDRLG